MPRRGDKPTADEDDDNVHYVDDDHFHDEPLNNNYENPLPEEQPRRQFKYSTANMREDSKMKKWCCIFMTFVLMLGFMIALSMIMQHYFFSETSDNAPAAPVIDENATFNEEKATINAACARGTYNEDDGQRCQQYCLPQFFECCDPFGEYDAMKNITRNVTENADNGGWGANRTMDLTNCSLDKELRGCVSYSRCQAVGEYELHQKSENGNERTVSIEPAPATLSVLCSFENLDKDPVSCESLCEDVACCYSKGPDNCMAESFDICLDYAPCQNLRPERPLILETAPDDLDVQCLWQQPSCTQACRKAECCGNPSSACLQLDFISCLTYAACTNVTTTNIQLAPQYSQLPKVTEEVVSACGEHNALSELYSKEQMQQHASFKSCTDLCEPARCCWTNGEANCFFEDPLGCLAWEQECQTLFSEGRRSL